ncbi:MULTISPECIES: ABC transporter ATP-binding protein [unclassified Arthrobacter]|uniref:ABC transporter ATP-binding protein n=1 Tax=unclassified Arthrobacter TaxID=235627 RepID=UPI001E5642DB|nr:MULTISPECIES: ABC transporter ATP-binding protein [unclassified Arthrobacter]MCC9146530.1 ABC transporter ATP-binding protein [Arthrobacter sp. zg-Y919]MDK1277760.1 ABC transporter ATP-binding protein [Arthrobacter sp. zg.Y919]WIB02285.1 ABC transporter ATP-binding protein [Arthrobacter sp. zg-Y919]
MQEQQTDRSVPTRLRLDGITVRFGGLTALDSVSLDIPAGRIVGIMGPNGAGKTTLFNVICGVFAPNEGSLELDGQGFTPKPHLLTRSGVARTLQGLGLFPGLTVLENVMTGLAAGGPRRGPGLLALPGSVRREARLAERAQDALEALGVGRYAAALPDTLPYGIRKKVALARALVSEPRLLLLDEPAGGLGQDDIDELASIIRTVPGDGCSVALVEHHVDLVMAVCDRIAVLDFGRLIAEGTPAEIGADPAVADAYLGVEAA